MGLTVLGLVTGVGIHMMRLFQKEKKQKNIRRCNGQNSLNLSEGKNDRKLRIPTLSHIIIKLWKSINKQHTLTITTEVGHVMYGKIVIPESQFPWEAVPESGKWPSHLWARKGCQCPGRSRPGKRLLRNGERLSPKERDQELAAGRAIFPVP